MFQRGNEAFNQKVQENTALKELRSFYLSKDKQSGNYTPKAVLHLHGANQAVIVKIHELKMKQPDGTDKYVQALCMNELGKPCECCMKGMYPSTVAIYKIYDFTQYTSTQDNQTKQVGVRPMLAKKTQQGFITSLASADPQALKGRVVAYGRSGQYGRDWNVQMNPQQMTEQQLISFQNFMGGYTNQEIMDMLPITDEKLLGEVLTVIARGGAGTANSSFNPNSNGGGSNFDPNSTFNNSGANNNGGGMNFNTQNSNQNSNQNNGQNNGGMNFNNQSNGQSNNQNNNQNNGQNFNNQNNGQGSNNQNNGQGSNQQGNGQNFNNQNNGSQNNNGGTNFQTENRTVNHNNNVPDQSFNPDKGGSMGAQDPSLGGGSKNSNNQSNGQNFNNQSNGQNFNNQSNSQNDYQHESPSFTSDDIPF